MMNRVNGLAAAALALLLCSAASAAPLFGEWGSAFPTGTRAVELNAAFIHPIRFSNDHFYGGNVAGYYYVADEVSVGAELEGYFVDQDRNDTELGGLSAVVRWHFLATRRFTLFVDGAFGVSYAGDTVPEGGTHYNYTPKGGVGATLRLRDNAYLLGGARFFHLSNANLHGRDQNPSQDGVQYFLGVLFTF